MKHLAACIVIIILGLLARLAGSLALPALPSMASADGVAARPGPVETVAWLLIIALPYIFLAAALWASRRKKRLRPQLAYAAAAALVLLPALALSGLHLAGITISDALLFWEVFPALHAAVAVLPYFYLDRIAARDVRT